MTRSFRLVTFVLLGVGLVAGSAAARALPEGFRLEPIATGLTRPSSIAATPDGRLLITERTTGDLRQLRLGELVATPLCHVNVVTTGEAGLLGVAVHPQFPSNGWVYLYYTSSATNKNKVTRYTVTHDSCSGALDILSDLGAGPNFLRNGGGIAFSKTDGKLYVATGDVEAPGDAELDGVLTGKILRVNDNGSIPADNPDPASYVYAKGVRNGRGVAIAPAGQVYAVDAGDVSDLSHDELNPVPAGGDLGWDNATGSSGGVFDDPMVNWATPIGAGVLALYGAQAFPDQTSDAIDNDEDRYGADLWPGVAKSDDNGQGICVGSTNTGNTCTSNGDCSPPRAGEVSFCYFLDETAEYCPGGTPAGDDACGADGTDEPDESFTGNLFMIAEDNDQVRRRSLPATSTPRARSSTRRSLRTAPTSGPRPRRGTTASCTSSPRTAAGRAPAGSTA
jgi:hypothetical protein